MMDIVTIKLNYKKNIIFLSEDENMDMYVPDNQGPDGSVEVGSVEVNKVKEEKLPTTAFKMGKVLLWFAGGLLITGLLAMFLPDIYTLAINAGASVESVNTFNYVTMIIAAVLVFVSVLIISIKSFSKKSVLMVIGYTMYTVSIGFLLGNLFMILATAVGTASTVRMISLAFLIASGVFLVFGLVGTFSKGNFSILYPLLTTLLLGVSILSLLQFLVFHSAIVYYIIELAVLAYFCIYVAIDFKRVKTLADTNLFDGENNLALYCAYQLYADFIAIFVRLLILILASSGRSKD